MINPLVSDTERLDAIINHGWTIRTSRLPARALQTLNWPPGKPAFGFFEEIIYDIVEGDGDVLASGTTAREALDKAMEQRGV